MEIIVLIKVAVFLPLEEEEVQVVVVLGEEVAQDSVWVATFDLVGRQAEVDTLYKVPELSDGVPVEPPVEQKKTQCFLIQILQIQLDIRMEILQDQ